MLNKQGYHLPAIKDVDSAKYTPCGTSVLLIQRCQPAILNDYVPVIVGGDGNCLFRSVSLALYGTEQFFGELRVRTCIEIAMFRAWYDASHHGFCASFKDEPFIVCPSYGDLCRSVTKAGEYADVMSVLALSAVTGCKIQMCFPTLTASFSTHPLTRCLVGRGVKQHGSKTVTILWTTAADVPSTGPVAINHFVPLLKKPVCASVVVNVSSPDGVATERDVTDDIDVKTDDEQLEEEPVSKERKAPTYIDDGDGNGNGDANGNGSCIDSISDAVVRFDVDDANGEDCCNDVNSIDRFKTCDEVYSLLVTPRPGDIVPDVPRGRKINCSFLVDNKLNMNRKVSNQKNRFWDDCGVWDTKQGRTLTSTYVRKQGTSGYSLQSVRERNNVYCIKRRINKKMTWEPLNLA